VLKTHSFSSDLYCILLILGCFVLGFLYGVRFYKVVGDTCVASYVELLAGSSPYDVRVFYPALITSALCWILWYLMLSLGFHCSRITKCTGMEHIKHGSWFRNWIQRSFCLCRSVYAVALWWADNPTKDSYHVPNTSIVNSNPRKDKKRDHFDVPSF
jgi:hypothetical protein